jgi:hypothetical protein
VHTCHWPLRSCRVPVLVAALFLASPLAVTAQMLVGHVVDAATMAPIAEATIRVSNAAGREVVAVISDSTGWFATPLPAGSYTLAVAHAEYPQLASERVQVGRGERVSVELRLGPRPIGMEPILVRARAPTAETGPDEFYRRMARQRQIGQGSFITREELQRTATFGINEILSRDPAIMIVRVTYSADDYFGDPGRSAVVMRHAGRECVPQLIIDGVRIGHSEERQRDDPMLVTDLSVLINRDALEGVEIYRTAAETPPELRREGCGTIVFWTRRVTGNPFTLRRVAIASVWVVLGVIITR